MKKDELVKTIQDLIASKKQRYQLSWLTRDQLSCLTGDQFSWLTRDQLSCLTVKTLESIKELLEEAE